MTNGDVIRGLTDEELQVFLLKFESGEIDYSKTFCDMCCKDAALEQKSTDCEWCLLWWLKNNSKCPQGLDACCEPDIRRLIMLTDRQRMQIKRSIGYKYGFMPETVDLVNISNVKENIVIDGGRIKIQVDFSHQTGYWGTEIFSINPSDMRTSPHLIRENR